MTTTSAPPAETQHPRKGNFRKYIAAAVSAIIGIPLGINFLHHAQDFSRRQEANETRFHVSDGGNCNEQCRVVAEKAINGQRLGNEGRPVNLGTYDAHPANATVYCDRVVGSTGKQISYESLPTSVTDVPWGLYQGSSCNVPRGKVLRINTKSFTFDVIGR